MPSSYPWLCWMEVNALDPLRAGKELTLYVAMVVSISQILSSCKKLCMIFLSKEYCPLKVQMKWHTLMSNRMFSPLGGRNATVCGHGKAFLISGLFHSCIRGRFSHCRFSGGPFIPQKRWVEIKGKTLNMVSLKTPRGSVGVLLVPDVSSWGLRPPSHQLSKNG